MNLVISSGHGRYVRGASGYIDEVDEARLVVERVAEFLRDAGADVETFHDNVSTSQNENLNRIVDFHNSETRDLDVSVHFNAYETTSSPMGCEVLYVSNAGHDIADRTVNAICTASGLKNRGPKKRTDLFFLNNTDEPAVLIETCFVDSRADCDIYAARFDEICQAIASGLLGHSIERPPGPQPGPEPEPPSGSLFSASGTCSWFGGPDDSGVSASEGLAFIFDYDEAPYLFLRQQPPGTSGLARRLDPAVFYIACRWDYDITSKEMLRDSGQMALVTARKTGIARLAHPADWGPHEEQTGRAADLSPGLMDNLEIDTDDTVDVVYPFEPPS